MASEKQIQANRQNATKSTGPKTPEGKAVGRFNALRHGATAETMVIPYLEEAKDWEAHLAGMLASLAPAGHLETVLAERVAALLWRLGRAARYEREVIAVGQETLERDLLSHDFQSSSLDDLRYNITSARRALRLLESLHDAPADKRLAGDDAPMILYAVNGVVEKFDINEDSLEPYVPDDVGVILFEGWTAGLVCQCVEIIAVQEGKSAAELLASAAYNLRVEELKAKGQLERATEKVGRARREQLLPEQKELEKISRYEAHLDRSLYKALHELQRLQAARQGVVVPLPVAVDVDVTGMPDQEN